MKFRSDFVTNSSSSSYLTIHFSGGKISELLKEHESLFEDLEETTVINGEFHYEPYDDESSYGLNPPKKISDFTDTILEFFEENLKYSEGLEDSEELDDLISEIKDCKEEINQTITFVDWKNTELGWEGDSEARYWHNYDDNEIRRYMKLNEDAEITEQIMAEFTEKVHDATSNETAHYLLQNGEESYEESFELTWGFQ